MNKKTNRFLLTFSVVLMISVIVGTQFVAPVSAKTYSLLSLFSTFKQKVLEKLEKYGYSRPTVTDYDDDDFNYIVGKLNGAEYALCMPDNWNGMLILMCRGHTTEMPHVPPAPSMLGTAFMNSPITLVDGKRFAFAMSNYGEGGYCIEAGVKSIHQLTKYIIWKYHVTGKIFLMSMSMGGAVSLTLAKRYPYLYSGVADFSGVKDLAASYAHKTAIASLATSSNKRNDLISYFKGPPTSIDSADLPFLTDPTWTGSPLIPDAYKDDTEVSAYIDGAGGTAEEMETECGGSPAMVPLAYKLRSPICNPRISMPVIIVHGTADTQVPYSQSVAYCDAVNARTEPDLCRLYPKPHAGHTSMAVYGQMVTRFLELFAWSNELDP